MTNNTESKISSDTAHKMRTPLAVIQMNSEMGMINPRLDEETRAILQSNVEEVQKLSKMIEGLLGEKAAE